MFLWGVQGFWTYQFSVFQYLLQCLPAWSRVHLLNDASSKPVRLSTTWLGKELSSSKIALPDFSFKLRIDQGRKLKYIKAENICSEKIRSLFSCPLSLSTALTDCVSDEIQQRKHESIEKRFLPNISCSQQNPLLFLKIQASNEIIWFEMHRRDQRNRPIAFYVSSLQADHL